MHGGAEGAPRPSKMGGLPVQCRRPELKLLASCVVTAVTGLAGRFLVGLNLFGGATGALLWPSKLDALSGSRAIPERTVRRDAVHARRHPCWNAPLGFPQIAIIGFHPAREPTQAPCCAQQPSVYKCSTPSAFTLQGR